MFSGLILKPCRTVLRANRSMMNLAFQRPLCVLSDIFWASLATWCFSVCWLLGYNMLFSWHWGTNSPILHPCERFGGLLLPPGCYLNHHVYGGLSTFTQVTLAVKHLWNRMSGFCAWLSQSSFLLMKCFLNPCGPVELVPLVLLEPSLTSLPEMCRYINSFEKHNNIRIKTVEVL